MKAENAPEKKFGWLAWLHLRGFPDSLLFALLAPTLHSELRVSKEEYICTCYLGASIFRISSQNHLKII